MYCQTYDFNEYKKHESMNEFEHWIHEGTWGMQRIPFFSLDNGNIPLFDNYEENRENIQCSPMLFSRVDEEKLSQLLHWFSRSVFVANMNINMNEKVLQRSKKEKNTFPEKNEWTNAMENIEKLLDRKPTKETIFGVFFSAEGRDDGTLLHY